MRCWMILGSVFFTSVVSAKNFGAGVILGGPTGLSANYFLSANNSIDGALAWDLGEGDVHVHSDYLWHRRGELKIDNVALDWFYGAGGRLVFVDHDHHHHHPHDDHDDFRLGVRGPIGVSYTFQDPRIEVFGELALIMNLVESTSVDLDGGIGARYYF